MQGTGYPVQQPPPPASAAPKKYDGQNGMPLYDHAHGGHYGASAAIAAQGHAPPPETFSGHWGNVSQGLNAGTRDILNTYWQQVVTALETENHDYKIHQLPLARIKKVMKADPEVKMISAEAPIISAKACETFITELTMRAWIIAEENKRRTLQRSDIAAALGKSDMFDFLIDIVPREVATPQHKRRPDYDEPQPGAPEQGHVPQPPHQQQQQPQHEFLSAQPEQQVQQAYYPQQPVFDPSMYQQVYTGAPPEQQGQYGSG